METNKRFLIVFSATVCIAGFALGSLVQPWGIVNAQSDRVFELRTYTAPEGKLDNLHARFRDHTMRIFEKHGMTSVGYWAPQDEPLSETTLIYLISHESRAAATESWASFRDDPEWQKVSRESQVDGRIVSNVERVFMKATDYSPMK